jgi:hypothetical protein
MGAGLDMIPGDIAFKVENRDGYWLKEMLTFLHLVKFRLYR